MVNIDQSNILQDDLIFIKMRYLYPTVWILQNTIKFLVGKLKEN